MLEGRLSLGVLLVLVGTILCGIAAGWAYFSKTSPTSWFVGFFGFLGATLIGVGVLVG